MWRSIRWDCDRSEGGLQDELSGLVRKRLSLRISILILEFSLDRTNFVQDILSRTTLEQYLLLVRREWLYSNVLWTHHRELWAENGDALSRIYAGTGALNTSFTRSGKRTLAGTWELSRDKVCSIVVPGVLSDATKSVSRAYINNFQDKGKQVAIDMFLVCISNLWD